MKSDNNDWLSEYQEFVNHQTSSVPNDLSDKVFLKMKKLIQPSAWFVFFKILLTQLFVGFLSLSICHQFGVNPFNTTQSLDALFMHFGGHSVCMVICGILFVGLGLLASGIFLSIEEVIALKRTKFQQFFSIGMISLGFLTSLGAELAIGLAGLWFLGALIGSFLATETIWKLKTSM